MRNLFNRSAVIILVGFILVGGCDKKEDPAGNGSGDKTPAPNAPVVETPAVKAPVVETPVVVEPANLGDKAASLEGLKILKGKPVSFEDGKVYVVEFWATWCGPCLTSIPHLTEVQKKYKDKGVTIIGITNENDIDKVKAFVSDQGEKMDYTVAVDADRKVSDGYMKAYAQRGIPTAFIVDQKGNVAWVGHPMGGLDEILGKVVDGTFDLEAFAKEKAEKEAAAAAVRQLFTEYFSARIAGSSNEETRAIAEKIFELNDPMILNELAWRIMTTNDVDETKRDYETALKAVSKANADTDSKNPSIMDTYAVALSKTGKLKEAIVIIQKALELAGDNERMKAYFNKQLEKYQKELAEKVADVPDIPATPEI